MIELARKWFTKAAWLRVHPAMEVAKVGTWL